MVLGYISPEPDGYVHQLSGADEHLQEDRGRTVEWFIQRAVRVQRGAGRNGGRVHGQELLEQVHDERSKGYSDPSASEHAGWYDFVLHGCVALSALEREQRAAISCVEGLLPD